MSNENILNAIDIIASNKIKQLKFDRTIIATISEVVSEIKGEYRVTYEAGSFLVYSEDPAMIYKVGQSVYIKIPENDYSNKKFIEGVVKNQANKEKVVDLSQVKTLANQQFELVKAWRNQDNEISYEEQSGEEYKPVLTIKKDQVELYKAYQSLYRNKESFLKLNTKITGKMENDQIANYGLRSAVDGASVLDLKDMSGTPFNRGEIGTIESSYLNILEKVKNNEGKEDEALPVFEWFIGNENATNLENATMNYENAYLEFGELLDYSKTPYHIVLSTPKGNKVNGTSPITIEAKLYKEGKDITNDKTVTYQWYKQNPNEASDADAGPGWEKLGGQTASTLEVTTAGQCQYKVVAFYDEKSSISEVITVNPATGELVVDQEGNVTLNGDSSVVTIKYFTPSGEELLEFNKIYPYLTVMVIDDTGNIYTTVWKQPTYSANIIFKGDDLFHYNANSDISAQIANKEYIIEVDNGADKEFLSIEWYLLGEDTPLKQNEKYSFDNSMLQSVWVDPKGALHFKIKDTYSIRNWNNTFKVVGKTIEPTIDESGNSIQQEKTYTSLKEIYFIKDGQQGTNGTEYCCVVRPVASDGVTLLSEAEAIMCDSGNNTSQLKLKAFVYKNSKLVTDTNVAYSWSAKTKCLTTTAANETVCTITHNSSTPLAPNLHLVTLTATVNGSVIYFNYPICYYNGSKNTFVELSYPKYVQYTAAGRSPEWLDKKIICAPIVGNVSITSQNEALLTIANNKIIPAAKFNFENGVGVIQIGNLYCPVMMYLNTFGNEAINGWDGTSIKLDDENNTIFAPQIGAGEKDKDTNLFTGLIMGKDQSIDEIGLYGYNQGKLSFGLDKNGNAFFGKERQVEFNNENEEYSISGWMIEDKELSGGSTTLHSSNGITTNTIKIDTSDDDGKIVNGYIGYNKGDNGEGATNTLGIKSDNSIVIESLQNIRLSAKDIFIGNKGLETYIRDLIDDYLSSSNE